jgi:hypothetical protein
MLDMVNHHRGSVLQHNTFPNKRGGQKFIAATSRRYARKRRDGSYRQSIDSLLAESFMFSGVNEIHEQFEFGGTVKAANPFVIPMRGGGGGPLGQAGLFAAKGFRDDVKGLGRDVAEIVNFPGARGVLVEASRSHKGGTRVAFGWVRTTRRQPAMLNFYKQWDSVIARAMPKFQRDLEAATTTAGQQRFIFDAAKLDARNAAKSLKDAEKRLAKAARSGTAVSDEQTARVARLAEAAVRRDALAKALSTASDHKKHGRST